MGSRGTQGGQAVKPIPVLAALALWLSGCFDDRVAGGTDEVENPAFTVHLMEGAQGVTGEVRVYARFQNPAKNPVPLLTLAAGSKGALITPATLRAAMDSSAKAGVPWPHRDTIRFNVTGTREAGEAFAADFLLIQTAQDTGFTRVGAPPSNHYSSYRLTYAMPLEPAVTAYKGSVGSRGVSLGLATVFVPGSPYHAAVGADGSFTVARLAPGRYDVKALDKDGKVWSAQDSLATSVPFAPADWSEADIIWVGD